MSLLKKGTALLVTAVLSFGLLAGCGAANTPPAANATPAPGQSQGQDKPEELVQKEPFTFYMRTNVGKESKPDNQRVLELIEEKSGIKIEAIAISNEAYKDRIDLMIAGGEEFDGMNLVGYGQDYSPLLEKQAIVPLNDLIDQYGPNVKKVMGDALYAGTYTDGSIYALPRREKFPEGYVPTIRQDWLEKFNMDMPQTIEELEAYLEAVKTQDPNGDGQNDEIPFLGDEFLYGMSNFAPYFIGANCSSLNVNGTSVEKYLSEDGSVKPIYAHPNFKSMLALFSDWYSKGYLHVDAALLKTTQINDLKNANRVGMTAGWYSTGVRAAVAINEQNPEIGAKYVAIPPLKNAPAKSAWPSNPQYGAQTVVMSTSKNSPFLMKYFDWMLSSPENLALVEYGIEGEHWEWADKDKNEIKLIGNATDSYAGFYALGNLYFKEMPLVQVSEENLIDYEYYQLQTQIRGFEMLYPFDSHIPYKTVGTEAEFLTADGLTLLHENIVKIILGQQELDSWDAIIEQYMEMEGNIRTEVWTEQYQEFNQ